MELKRRIDEALQSLFGKGTTGLPSAPQVNITISNKFNVHKNASIQGNNFGAFQNTTSLVPDNPGQDFNVQEDYSYELHTALEKIKSLKEGFDYRAAIDECNVLFLNGKIDEPRHLGYLCRLLAYTASCYMGLDDFDRAKVYLDKCDEKSLGKSEWYFITMFVWLFNQNKYLDAIDLTKQAMKAFPHSLRIASCYAIAHATTGGCDYAIWLSEKHHDAMVGGQEIDETKYKQDLVHVYLIQRDEESMLALIGEYKDIDSAIMKAFYLVALHLKAIKNATGKDNLILREKLDFQALSEIYRIIKNLPSESSEHELNHIYKSAAYVLSFSMILIDHVDDAIAMGILENINEQEVLESISTGIMLLSHAAVHIPEGVQQAADAEALELQDLADNKQFEEIISRLWPSIRETGQFRDFHCDMLLAATLNSERFDIYSEACEWLKSVDRFTNMAELLDIQYQHSCGNKEAAITQLTALLENTKDPGLIFGCLRVANGFGLEDLVIKECQDIFENRSYLIDAINPTKLSKLYSNALIRAKDYVGYERFINSIRLRDDVDELVKIELELNYAIFADDIGMQIALHEKAYEKMNGDQHLFQAAQLHLMLMQLPAAQKCIVELERNNHSSMLHRLKAAHFILSNDYESAYKEASAAAELDKDEPLSLSHQFLWSVGLRTGKEEALRSMVEYTARYPMHEQFVRRITALRTDEAGNEVLTDEVMQLLSAGSEQYDTIQDLYASKKIGLALYSDLRKLTLTEVFEMDIEKYLFEGNVEHFVQETQNSLDEIAVDAVFLYFLSRMGLLDVLVRISQILVPYSTMVVFHNCLMKQEDRYIRDIIEFLQRSANVQLCSPAYPLLCAAPLIRNHPPHDSEILTANAVESCLMASSGCVICYGDPVIAKIHTTEGRRICGITAFISICYAQGWVTRYEFGKAWLDSCQFRIGFLNIGAEMLLAALDANGGRIDGAFAGLLEIKVSGDALSYLRVFVGLIRDVRNSKDLDTLKNVCIAIMEALDKRQGRLRYLLGMERGLLTVEDLDKVSTISSITILGIAFCIAMLICEGITSANCDSEVISMISENCPRIDAKIYREIIENTRDFVARIRKEVEV